MEFSSATPLKDRFTACPICAASLDRCSAHKSADCSYHPLYTPTLPRIMTWLRCEDCAHVFTDTYWTAEGERQVFSTAHAYQLPAAQQVESLRNVWAPTVHRVADRLCELRGREAVLGRVGAQRPVWLDIGFGAGGLVMVAEEFGFSALGVDVRERAVIELQSLGYRAICSSFETLQLDEPLAVLSMADVLEHLADPVAALRKVNALLAADGLLYISCPNSDTATWRQWEAANTNPYWGELEHYHNFSRGRLIGLLQAAGFAVVDYFVSARYYSCMEIVARKISA